MRIRSRVIARLPVIYAAAALFASSVAALPTVQAQVYLPGVSGAQDPPTDVDPDIFRTFSDAGESRRSASQFNCAGERAGSDCYGIFFHRLANPGVDRDVVPPRLIFDWQVRAGQPPQTGIPRDIDTGTPGNFLQAVRLNLHFDPAVIGLPGAVPGTRPGFWGPGCVAVPGDVLTGRGDAGSDSITEGYASQADGLQLVATDNEARATVLQRSDFSGGARLYVIPHDRYVHMMRIHCPVQEDQEGQPVGQPANIAFQAPMIGDTGQATDVTGASLRYASVASNNLWYYPLDGAPAIVDAELGHAGPEHAYLDLTFSTAVTTRDGTWSAEIFNQDPGGTAPVSMGVAESTTPADNTALTVRRVIPLSADVLRLYFDEDLHAVAAGLGDPNPVVLIDPPEGIFSEAEPQAPLHTGTAWRLRVFFDYAAPYIKRAEVGPESRFIDVLFSEQVQFNVFFDEVDGVPRATTRVNTESVLPPPEPEDFVIVHYRNDGTVDRFNPSDVHIPGQTSSPSPLLESSLRLVMPEEGEYAPGETVDIRLAERVKNLNHPGLGAAFDRVDEDVKFKSSKFATAQNRRVSNYPRAAAPAQVGSLPLRGREYRIVAVNDALPDKVKTGDGVELTFRLEGPPLESDDFIEATLGVRGDAAFAGERAGVIRFRRSGHERTVVWFPNRNALDEPPRRESEPVSVYPRSIMVNGPVEVLEGTSSATALIRIVRAVRVAAYPAHHEVRINPVQVDIGLSEYGAGLSEEESLTVSLGLHSWMGGQSIPVDENAGVVLLPDDESPAGDGSPMMEVTLAETTPRISLYLLVTDDALASTSLHLVALPSSLEAVYQTAANYRGMDEGCASNFDEDANVAAGCIATVRAAGGRSFSLSFELESGGPARLLTLRSGQSRQVHLVFRMLGGDMLNSDESVRVTTGFSPGVFGATASRTDFTFNRANASPESGGRLPVTLGVPQDAPAGMLRFMVQASSVTEGAPNRRMLVNLPESGRPDVAIDVRPSLTFIAPGPPEDTGDESDLPEDFRDVVNDLFPGSVPVVFPPRRFGSTLVHVLVPGIGAETPVDATAFLRGSFSPSLGVCASALRAGEEATVESVMQAPGDCELLSASLAAMPTVVLPPYRSVLYWVGVDAEGRIAEDFSGALMQEGTPIAVYVAPPVGFISSYWKYNDLAVEVPLGAGVADLFEELVIELEVQAGEDAGEDTPILDFINGRASYPVPPVLLPDIGGVSTSLQITRVNDVAFSRNVAPVFSDDEEAREVIEDHTLFSLGNDSLTLSPQAYPLPDVSVDDGAFLSSSTKRIVAGPGGGYSVTVYRYSSEEDAFVEMTAELSLPPVTGLVVSITHTAQNAAVRIESDVPARDVTLPYPVSDTAIFEIVFSISGSSTKIRTFRVVAPNPCPDVDCVTLVGSVDGVSVENGDVFEMGPYAYNDDEEAGREPEGVLADPSWFRELSGAADRYDFVVKGLPGGLAVVSVSLEEAVERRSIYHVYQQQGVNNWGWAPFVVNDYNRVFSAPEPCPAPSASRQPFMPPAGAGYAWQLADEGIDAGDGCLLLEIRDGGMNDADQTENAIAYQTGTVALPVEVPPIIIRGGGRGGGSMDLPWLLLLFLAMLLAARVRRI